MNLTDYVLVHKKDHEYLEKRVSELESENSRIMNHDLVKHAWLAESMEDKAKRMIELGNRMADRSGCVCWMPGSPILICSKCQKAISEWKKFLNL